MSPIRRRVTETLEDVARMLASFTHALEQVHPCFKIGQKAPQASQAGLQCTTSSSGKAWDPPAWASPWANPAWAQA
ncbi:hypothetical protein Pyn_00949 [Prunus yedoensis var. nudiflora]|uniref:Uncharacterized protein n=1 Tax=Prunus yedoensis var. nudiflora TaxID=2094558 RepID=A0A314UGJ6_PRUYE|nr:hypothetical protein Pyn_00949 [Prunus yedoensis var. nudiflora]